MKSSNSLLSFMDDDTKAQVQDLQKGQTVTLADGRQLGEIDVTLIDADEFNIRQDADSYEHESMALSMEDVGLLEPITVTEEGERYKILTGEQRWTSWMLLHAKDPDKYAFIPAIIKPEIKVKTEKSVKSVRIKTQLIENFSRFDGTIFDLADAIIELWQVEGKEYAIAALKQTKHASNNTALSRLKSIASTTIGFRKRINKAGIEGKGTIETLSKINKKEPLIFNDTLDKYEAGEIDKPLDTEANDVWRGLSDKKKHVEKENLPQVSKQNNDDLNQAGDKLSIESPQASLQADNIEINGNTLKISIKNGSELLILLPKGLKLEVSG